MSEVEDASSDTPSATSNHEQQVNLEAIMHVPLDVSVELGRVQLPLHVVARLHRGMILDLKKEANAEVNILANGRVFARGEVVAADGKLGVRVIEVIPPGDRIQSLSS
ncbi:MAG: FliM/FliN family flagellar motor switch protein [Mariprofundaceae bacterium]|nr:FliM/FliN family flagellar motor switch protein [Mariprofundaceae bacterium]